MASVVIRLESGSLEVYSTECGITEEFNVAIAMAKAIRGFDGAFKKKYDSSLEDNLLRVLKETKPTESKPPGAQA